MSEGRTEALLTGVFGRIVGTLICTAIGLTILGLGLRLAYQQPMNSKLTFPIIGLTLIAVIAWPFLLRIRRK